MSNLYTRQHSVWEAAEGDRLVGMDQMLEAVATADVLPALDYVETVDKDTRLLDIGAGTGTIVEQLATGRGAYYYAADINRGFLEERTTPRGQLIVASSENLPVRPQSFDVTYSRAVTGWSKRPELAIANQLRATRLGGVAIFTEFDWTRASVDRRSDGIAAVMKAKAIMEGVLGMSGFNSRYGAQLGSDIQKTASVLELEAWLRGEPVQFTRIETAHDMAEPGDHRGVFLEAANNARLQLAAHKSPQARSMANMLGQSIETIENVDTCLITLPALVTQTVFPERPE